MSTFAFWLAVTGAGIITFAFRLSFIALMGKIEIPVLLSRALRFVPAAVFTAVVVPLLFYVDGAVDVSLGNDRLLAGLAAVLIAWRTRSVPLTLVGGMATLWVLQAIALGQWWTPRDSSDRVVVGIMVDKCVGATPAAPVV
jgi:branched-subunit amino acid transport protein